ncbi:putative acyldehydrogenase [Phaeomoniella chlamydospora]|uniref:Short/branched chain specific acyl-CoA dehydrogenase, mitochondrial n=1 Tax=Phaeomoniella chlamydospora TaxID=158046 RepID=A0A0G2ECS8_PHACM|nr:putative acyldehydrogenase [Phaeomoniella chlamydospora]
MANLAKSLRSFARYASSRPTVRRIPATTIIREYGPQSIPMKVRADEYHSARTFTTTAPPRYADTAEEAELIPTPITHFSEVETMMSESVSKFAKEVIAPKVREMDENETMDPAIVEQLFEQGLMGVEIPEEYGGSGMNFTSAIVGIEELARVDPSVSVLCDVHNTLVVTAILKWGTAEAKRRWLPALATKTVGSFCLSEPVSGSDAFALKTKAEKTADGYKINGSKMWITNSMEADFFIVFANLDPSKGYKGITAFIVEKADKGFSIAKKEKKLGIRASSTCVINFDDVEIPSDRLLGKEGDGYKYAIGLLNEGRIGIAAQMTGLALGAWENAAQYVWNDRKQFGQLVGTFQGMQHQLAQAYTEIVAARALVYNAARKKELGQDFVMDAAMAKLYASQVAGRVSGSAVEWMGGMGFVREGIAEKMFRDSKIGAIYEGTSNIQLTTIAKMLQKEYTQ